MATKKKGGIRVDFTGVSSEGGGRLLPEGVHQFEVTDVTTEEGQDSGKEYLKIEMEVADGDFKGTKAWDNMSLQPQALWKLRGFLEAAGYPTEDGPMDLSPDDMIGLMVEGEVFHEEYKGKTKHKIASYVQGETKSAEKEPEPTTTKKKKAAAPEPEEEATEWKVKQKVAFMDGKKRIEGTIKALDGDQVTVRAGSDEYEMDVSDLIAS